MRFKINKNCVNVLTGQFVMNTDKINEANSNPSYPWWVSDNENNKVETLIDNEWNQSVVVDPNDLNSHRVFKLNYLVEGLVEYLNAHPELADKPVIVTVTNGGESSIVGSVNVSIVVPNNNEHVEIYIGDCKY